MNYCEFINIRGIPFFVDFVDSKLKKFKEYLSPYTYVLTIPGIHKLTFP
jgi:hypothetical protein